MLDNSDVLNQDQQVQPDGPVQPDVEPMPEVLNQVTTSSPSKSMYTSAARPMQEKDHASEIAANVLDSQSTANATFDTQSPAAKEYDTDVKTYTTMSNGQQLNGVFKSQYSLDAEHYAVDDNQDHLWNKLAKEDAQLYYDQQAAQARYESIQAKQELDKAQSSAFNNYFASAYSARQTQDKMGWTGGQQTASDLQVQFLQAETAANMYTQAEMQKYGVDTKLGIARMYAEAEQKTLALKYYQDALDQAVQEANETGCYVPPEAREMFAQDKMANDILANPGAHTQQEIDRATQVLKNTQAYYDSLGFERWDVYDEKTGKVVTEYYGVKTLQKLTLEETIRNNKENERLQKAANDIASNANAIASKQLRLAQKQFELDKAIQNQLEINNILQQGTKKKSNGTDYYIDASGKAVGIPQGTEIYETGTGSAKAYYYVEHDGAKNTAHYIYSNADGAANSKENVDARRTASMTSAQQKEYFKNELSNAANGNDQKLKDIEKKYKLTSKSTANDYKKAYYDYTNNDVYETGSGS